MKLTTFNRTNDMLILHSNDGKVFFFKLAHMTHNFSLCLCISKINCIRKGNHSKHRVTTTTALKMLTEKEETNPFSSIGDQYFECFSLHLACFASSLASSFKKIASMSSLADHTAYTYGMCRMHSAEENYYTKKFAEMSLLIDFNVNFVCTIYFAYNFVFCFKKYFIYINQKCKQTKGQRKTETHFSVF